MVLRRCLSFISVCGLIGSLSWLGERVVLDLGLAGLVQKFEDEFGRKWTRRILALIGATVIVLCLGVLYSFTKPIIVHLATLYLENAQAKQLMNFFFGIFFILGTASMASLIADAFDGRHLRKEAERHYAEAIAKNNEIKESIDEMRECETEMRTMLLEVGDICITALNMASTIAPENAEVAAEIEEKKRSIESFLEQLTAKYEGPPSIKDPPA